MTLDMLEAQNRDKNEFRYITQRVMATVHFVDSKQDMLNQCWLKGDLSPLI